MNGFEKQYLENKEAVMDCIKEAIGFFEKFEHTHEMETCKYQLENVQNGEFTIVLVGEFSAGKSTLLNALMGDKLLPSFSSETTATVNFLRHKNKSKHGEEGRVFYRDGREIEIETADFDTISRYVSTESDENVASTISHLDLYLDSRFLENNVTLVDSPGLNGVADGHREITEEQIEKSSASIFVFDAHQPGSKSDFVFLKNLQKRVKGIICVLNQIDCIKVTEGQTVESVITKLKNNYKKMIPDAETIPEIIPIAAYPALVARGSAKIEYNGKIEFSDEEREKFEEISRMEFFENRLWKYLTQGEKTRQMLLAPLEQLEAQLAQIKGNKKNELDLLSGKTDENALEEQIIELEKQSENLNEMLSGRTSDINDELDLAEKELKEEIKAESVNLKNIFSRKLDNWQEIEDIDTDKIEKTIERDLNKIAEDALENYKDRVGQIIIRTGNDARELINERFAEDAFTLKLEEKIEKTEIKLGIDKYERDIAEMKRELERLESESDAAEADLAALIEKNNRRDALKEKIEQRKNYRDHYEEISQTMIPQTVRYTDSKKEEVDEGGFWGGIKRFVRGKKYEWRDVTIVDTKERDEYIKERNKKIENFNQEINALEHSLEREAGGNSASVEKKMAQINRKKEQKYEELETLRSSFKERNEKQIAEGLRKQKRAVDDFIENAVFDFEAMFKKELAKVRKITSDIIQDIVVGSITSQIENRKREIRLLQEKKVTTVQDKEANIRQIEDELQVLDGILLRALDLQSEIETIPADYIEEVAL